MPKGQPNKRYTGEFKQMVVEAVIKEKMSYTEAARIYEVSNHHRIQSWERIYLEKGPEGLYIGIAFDFTCLHSIHTPARGVTNAPIVCYTICHA